MTYPTKETIAVMLLPEVKKKLKAIEKQHPMDEPLINKTFTKDEWQDIEDMINAFLYLQDRQQWLEQYGHLRGENKV